MRTDWQYIKCDGCGKVYKFNKSDDTANDYLLHCYGVYVGDDEFEFCSDECLLKYVTDYVTEHIQVDMKIDSFVLDVCKAVSDIK